MLLIRSVLCDHYFSQCKTCNPRRGAIFAIKPHLNNHGIAPLFNSIYSTAMVKSCGFRQEDVFMFSFYKLL